MAMSGERAGLTRGGTSGILVSSVLAAASTLVITIVAARVLTAQGDPSGYAEFMVFWSFLFGVYGIVVGMQNEATRAVGSSAGRSGESSGVGDHARVLSVAVVLSVATAIIVTVMAPWWGPRLTGASMPYVVPLVALGIVLYGIYEASLGASSGLRDWNSFSWLVTTDAVSRLALVAIAGATGMGLLGLETACVVASVVCLLILAVTGRGRRILYSRADVSFSRLVRNSLLSFVSSSSTAILVTAFPAIIKLSSTSEDPALLAGTITAISLTRSPIMIPLQSFQGVAITALLRRDQGVLRALLRPVLIIIAAGLVAAAVAWAIGPWILGALYGPAIIAHASTFAGLTIAAVPLAVLTLTGTAAIATNAHAWFAGGWFVAAVVASALLFLPLVLTERVIIGLFVGPLVGIVVHGIGIARSQR